MNKQESVLHLEAPKLLSCIDFDYTSKTFLELKESKDQSAVSSKNSRKNRSAYKVGNFLENKKPKNKQKKKLRSRFYVGNDISDINELDESDINLPDFIRSVKNIKNRKDIKGKVQFENIISDKDKASNQIYLSDPLTVQELAVKLHVASTDIIKFLFLKGISITINQLLDISISTLVAEHYSFNILRKEKNDSVVQDSLSSYVSGRLRTPVVTLLGHVDHGKTALLQAIRQNSPPIINEAGNITQSIGSYEVSIDNESAIKKFIFLDTPGHEAFIGMRKRVVSITDLAILVVSADDDLKPQAIEAIKYVQDRNIPFIVAVNKIDKPESDIDRVKKQLTDFDIVDINIGGSSTIIGVSALNGENIELLLSSIIALSESQNLRSDPSMPAVGIILEAYLDRRKGPVAQLLIQNGTLNVGDIVLAGNFYGRIKAIHDRENKKTKSIESVALADILCFTEVPTPGLLFQVVADEKTAKSLAASHVTASYFSPLDSRISLDDASPKYAKKIVKQINLIIKTSRQGAIDAIMHALSNLPQEKVQINILLVASGEVSLNDVDLAAMSNSLIFVFGLNVLPGISRYAEKRGVDVSSFNVIYDLIESIENYMLSFVDMDYEKQIIGHAEVKNLFSVNKGVVAGCFIKSGKLKKKSYFQVKRVGQKIYEGLIDSLKRAKDDVDQVFESNECGVMCKDYNLWQIGDSLECYELKSLQKTL